MADLPKLDTNPKAQDIVKWLNSLEKAVDSKPEETSNYIADQIIAKVFKEPSDALKPFATRKEYAVLVMKNWTGSKEAFTSNKSKTYFPVLVHLGGLRKSDKVPSDLSFNHMLALATALDRKIVKSDSLEAYAKELASVDEDKVLDRVTEDIARAKTANVEKAKKTRAAKGKAAQPKEPRPSLDEKELERIRGKVKDAKNQIRKIAADMESVLEDLLAEIRSAIKLSK
jgi:hypothetical protein